MLSSADVAASTFDVGSGSSGLLFSAGVDVGTVDVGSGWETGTPLGAADRELALGRPLGLRLEDVLDRVAAGVLADSEGTSTVCAGAGEGAIVR